MCEEELRLPLRDYVVMRTSNPCRQERTPVLLVRP